MKSIIILIFIGFSISCSSQEINDAFLKGKWKVFNYNAKTGNFSYDIFFYNNSHSFDFPNKSKGICFKIFHRLYSHTPNLWSLNIDKNIFCFNYSDGKDLCSKIEIINKYHFILTDSDGSKQEFFKRKWF